MRLPNHEEITRWLITVTAAMGIAGQVIQELEFAKHGEVGAGAESVFEFGQGGDFVAYQVLVEGLGIEGEWAHNVIVPTEPTFHSELHRWPGTPPLFDSLPAAKRGNLRGTRSTIPAAKTHYPFGYCSSWWFLLHPVSMEQFRSFLADESGQDLIEYTLLMSFVALASAALFIGAGKNVKGIWVKTSMQLSAANAQV